MDGVTERVLSPQRSFPHIVTKPADRNAGSLGFPRTCKLLAVWGLGIKPGPTLVDVVSKLKCPVFIAHEVSGFDGV